MATTSSQVQSAVQTKTFVERWYFTGIAVVMLLVSIAGFMPAIMHPAGRRAPLTLLAAAHGIVFFAWLLLFLAQSLLVALRRVGWHRRLGLASVFLLALIIPLSYTTTVALARRGSDLSGDQHITPRPQAGKTLELDAVTASVFNFVGLLIFVILAIAAIWLSAQAGGSQAPDALCEHFAYGAANHAFPRSFSAACADTGHSLDSLHDVPPRGCCQRLPGRQANSSADRWAGDRDLHRPAAQWGSDRTERGLAQLGWVAHAVGNAGSWTHQVRPEGGSSQPQKTSTQAIPLMRPNLCHNSHQARLPPG